MKQQQKHYWMNHTKWSLHFFKLSFFTLHSSHFDCSNAALYVSFYFNWIHIYLMNRNIKSSLLFTHLLSCSGMAWHITYILCFLGINLHKLVAVTQMYLQKCQIIVRAMAPDFDKLKINWNRCLSSCLRSKTGVPPKFVQRFHFLKIYLTFHRHHTIQKE